ncbi:MAG: response regulator [Desulfosarcina sp.]
MVMMVKMKLMLVDDEERFLQTTAKMLTRLGYDAVTASSGMECLQKLEQDLIHVVILDVKMPGLDGLETLKRIKQQFPMVEVIMLTGHATAESAVEGLKSGATDYLVKPTDIEALVAKAEAAYQKRVDLESKIRMVEAFKSSPV